MRATWVVAGAARFRFHGATRVSGVLTVAWLGRSTAVLVRAADEPACGDRIAHGNAAPAVACRQGEARVWLSGERVTARGPRRRLRADAGGRRYSRLAAPGTRT